MSPSSAASKLRELCIFSILAAQYILGAFFLKRLRNATNLWPPVPRAGHNKSLSPSRNLTLRQAFTKWEIVQLEIGRLQPSLARNVESLENKLHHGLCIPLDMMQYRTF